MEDIYSDSGSEKAQPVVAALRSAVAERKLSKELLLRYNSTVAEYGLISNQ